MLLVENGTVITPQRTIANGGVVIGGGRIEAVGRRDDLKVPKDVRSLDARGGLIAPGFLNIHVHGVGGYDASDGDVASLEAISLLLTHQGVTAWVPTTASAPLPQIAAAYGAIRAAMQNQRAGAEILGGHVEGPYLNPQERGAHPEELLIEPRPEDYRVLLDYADAIAVFTLAPELPGALDLITELAALGILVSAGHSAAIDHEFARAVDAGLSHSTHMFCNMGTLRRANLRRVAGLVESVLLNDRVTTEIIADGYVIAPSLMKLALKLKGTKGVAIITDGTGLTGLPPGPYSFMGGDIVLEEQIAYVADRSAFAGTASTMDHCVRVARESMDLSLEETFRMASLTPAQILGITDWKGSLEAGKDADVVILDDDLRVIQTVARGVVYEPPSEVRMEKGGALGWRVAL